MPDKYSFVLLPTGLLFQSIKFSCCWRQYSWLSLLLLTFLLLNCVSFSELKDDKSFKCNDETFAKYFNCTMNCTYGVKGNINCSVNKNIQCEGEHSFVKTMNCRYCYQTDPEEHICDVKTDCKTLEIPNKRRYVTNCTVKETTLCLGNREFQKFVLCNWTSGHRWSTAVVLSLTLGGFGVDRFYLGYWKEGLGKLFSFGGLGVWTLVDFILIVSEYVSPSDGSLYIF